MSMLSNNRSSAYVGQMASPQFKQYKTAAQVRPTTPTTPPVIPPVSQPVIPPNIPPFNGVFDLSGGGGGFPIQSNGQPMAENMFDTIDPSPSRIRIANAMIGGRNLMARR